ncbi:chitin transglycosylase UTR2 [Kluyveromyces lactis]|uniref:Crh-like protein n=1 Tax=Kluyveromyces lactis (strain ATCC 8585 / CBS 2359 / DSM 70799 / NBRC 1267 / NRRL Y-1140 / WM37) TaxID=284590 RepID=Q6CJQ0_KLULA|nr:uncharacterized protein KLLA0_F16907g [Kluyveromyces lactis]CAG98547.1 KLLA0F16907p [Kluyveromyces lactis]|eukprot:XP_455839.1 uncharacterized protein KLLA0_F16907g [Kluyveromyces lactis]
MRSFAKVLALAAVALKVVSAADETTTCSEDSHCPEDNPCCNQYGTCGTGSYCLGGCNPKFSYKKEACMPLPVCRDTITIFDNYTSKMANLYTYLGDASKANWTYEGYPIDYEDENALIMAMPKNSGGTVLSSTHYMWYGNIKTRMKASHGAGVVSAMILFSSVQDEIDYEWVGADLEKVQTNWYWQGALNYTNSKNLTATNNDEDYHIYEIDWKEDVITWSVDGEVGRTLFKNETYNSTSKQYEYPQTPSRVQLSLWPGGNATNEQGTINWAGGEIDWDSDDIKDYGYYYAVLESVNITCYDPPSGTTKNGSEVYQYSGEDNWLQKGVFITDGNTILKDYDNSGLDDNTPDESSSSSSSSSTSSSSKSSSTSTGSSSGSASTTTTAGSNDDTDESSSSSTSSSAAAGFVQNMSTTSSSGNSSSATSTSAAGAEKNLSYGFGLSLISLLLSLL